MLVRLDLGAKEVYINPDLVTHVDPVNPKRTFIYLAGGTVDKIDVNVPVAEVLQALNKRA